LLYCKRKFDIRCYILLTSTNGLFKGFNINRTFKLLIAYWYEEGYIRTSSKDFSLKHLSNRLIHLTNDAVQKKGEDYGKFENGNKVNLNLFS